MDTHKGEAHGTCNGNWGVVGTNKKQILGLRTLLCYHEFPRIGGPQYRTPHVIILIMGTRQKGRPFELNAE